MEKTPKSLRLQIGLFGRTNVGKSSLLNYLCGQDAAITSPVPGTTTDVVEKAMELLPLGPVLFLDTAGLDDESELSEKRVARARRVFDRADVAILVVEAGHWSDAEDSVLLECRNRRIPCLVVVNKIDLAPPDAEYLRRLAERKVPAVLCSCVDAVRRDETVCAFKKKLIELCPEEFLKPRALVGDLVRPGGLVVMVVPIDLEAPKGRLILPQVQAIRDLLDCDAAALVVKEREYRAMLERLKTPPDLVVCDSQVVLKTMAETPPEVRCTTFSILLARAKGDLPEMAHAARVIDELQEGDRVLIAEACTHHAVEDDIGRVKIPRWLKQYTGLNLNIDVYSGADFPTNLSDYRLIIHCGGCMLNRRAMLTRLQTARLDYVPVTNYGVCISYLQGVLARAIQPFADLLDPDTDFPAGAEAV